MILKFESIAAHRYIIEKRSRRNMEWQQCGQIEGNRCKGTAKGLTEGEEYQFRITALNKAGPSEPGQPSKWKEARARFCEYHIPGSHSYLLVFKWEMGIEE